jgi:hypothetical protein
MSGMALVCAAVVLRGAWPLRKQKSESWYDYYLRLYWFPANVVAVTVLGALRTFGEGPRALSVGWYLVALSWAALLAVASLGQRRGRAA